MQIQTISQVRNQSFIESIKELIKKLWNTFTKAFRMEIFTQQEEQNGYVALSGRAEKYELEYPLKKVWSGPVSEEIQGLKAEEIGDQKGYNRLISRLEGIQKRTRKQRIKKKLGKRISQLQIKSLAEPGRCHLGG